MNTAVLRLYNYSTLPSIVLDIIFVKTRDKTVTEIDYQLKYAIFSTACSIVYKYIVYNFCTRPISKRLYSGIFKDTKHKIFKKKTEFINAMYMFKIGVFL